MLSPRRVVITGVGIVSPIGLRLDKYWKSLIDKESGLKPLTRFDSSRFLSRFAAEVNEELTLRDSSSAHEIKRMDRFVRYALSAADDALADSGIMFMEGSGSGGSVYIGVGMGGLPHMEAGVVNQEIKGPRRTTPYLIPSLIPNMAASIIAMQHRLSCPQYTIAGSCASGIQSIGLGFQAIRSGNLDWALAGGTEAVITPICFSGFEAMRVLSRGSDPDSIPRPFDRERDGMIVGEGAAVFILEEHDSAVARNAGIYAELSGCSTSSGNRHIALQSSEDTMRCVKLALADSRLEASDVDCIYAQASGLKKGDEVELNAFQQIFGSGSGGPAITSIEGHIGHSFAASGALNLAALLGTLRENTVLPTRNLNEVEPEYSTMNFVREPREISIRHGLINSAGFGGINACLIASNYPP